MCVCVRRRLPPRSTRTDTLVPYTTRFRSAPSGSSSTGTRWRSKKTAHASEQERPDVLARRRAWFQAQPDLDPERLVFIDETSASTKMARPRGRAKAGERCRSHIPPGHWQTVTATPPHLGGEIVRAHV